MALLRQKHYGGGQAKSRKKFLVLIGAHWFDLVRFGLFGSSGGVVRDGLSEKQLNRRDSKAAEKTRKAGLLLLSDPAKSCKKLQAAEICAKRLSWSRVDSPKLKADRAVTKSEEPGITRKL